MKNCLLLLSLLFPVLLSAQNQNVSNGLIFDGEPNLVVNPDDPHHMVVAWMGFKPGQQIIIHTKTSFDAGETWSPAKTIPHAKVGLGSADPCMAFDSDGNVYLAYIDFSAVIDSGGIYLVKSTDGGLNWNTPVKAIDMHADPDKYAIDRPWIAVDRSGGTHDGNIYITSMHGNSIGYIPPPYHPYMVRSTNGGASFEPYRYLDDTGWLTGSAISAPMPTPAVDANGTLRVIYPSWDLSSSPFPRYALASSTDGGSTFNYQAVMSVTGGSSAAAADSLAKKGYLLKTDPSDANHMAFFYIGYDFGDGDILMRETYDGGASWSSAVRINDDPMSTDRLQDMVWADFDADGDLVVSWRDRRNGSNNTYETSAEMYCAVRWKDSTDFSANFALSDMLVAYDTVLAESGNDFMGVSLDNDTISAVWGDTRSGQLEIWFARLGMDGGMLSVQQIGGSIKGELSVYPNPATELLQIKLSVEEAADYKLVLYNMQGKQLQLLSDTYRQPGEYQVQADVSGLAAGQYLLELSSTRGIITSLVVVD